MRGLSAERHGRRARLLSRIQCFQLFPGNAGSIDRDGELRCRFVGFTGDVTSTTNPANVTVDTTKNITATFANSMITRDAVSHAVSTGSTSVLTWTHTLGSGPSRAVILAVGVTDSVASPDANAMVTSVLFNGVYATPIPNSLVYGGTTGMVQTQLFYLTDSELPAAGTLYRTGEPRRFGCRRSGRSNFAVRRQPGASRGRGDEQATTGVDLIGTSITTLTNNAWIIDLVEDNNVTAPDGERRADAGMDSIFDRKRHRR